MTTDIEFDAPCPSCGEVRLSGDQLWLVVTTSRGASDYFAFRCPRCCGQIQCAVDGETAAVLAELVAVEELVVPAEALEEHRGDALTLDDLIDFGADLACADFPAAAALPSAA